MRASTNDGRTSGASTNVTMIGNSNTNVGGAKYPSKFSIKEQIQGIANINQSKISKSY